jgi:hypothetical protein
MRTNLKPHAMAFAFCLTALLTLASEHAWANRYYAPELGRFIKHEGMGVWRYGRVHSP